MVKAVYPQTPPSRRNPLVLPQNQVSPVHLCSPHRPRCSHSPTHSHFRLAHRRLVPPVHRRAQNRIGLQVLFTLQRASSSSLIYSLPGLRCATSDSFFYLFKAFYICFTKHPPLFSKKNPSVVHQMATPSPSDSNTPSTEPNYTQDDRTQSPPAFLDLADSVSSPCFLSFSFSHIAKRLQGWAPTCLTCPQCVSTSLLICSHY